MHFEFTLEAFNNFSLYMEKAAKYNAMCRFQNKTIDADIWGRDFEKSIRYFLLQYLFAAMCLESFIYEYAASNFSDTYAKKYLDKLDLVSKWVVIPRLVLGKEFPKDSQSFEHLKEIRSERNNLVHSKSRPELTEEAKKQELAQYDSIFNSKPSTESEEGLSIFQWVVDIFRTLKKLEQECCKVQNWWQIIEI